MGAVFGVAKCELRPRAIGIIVKERTAKAARIGKVKGVRLIQFTAEVYRVRTTATTRNPKLTLQLSGEP